jgi:ATP synthase protein I
MTTEPGHPDQLDEAVRTRRQRQSTWKREGERSVAQNLAMIGVLGWTVVTPTLLGLFAGRWLDRELGLRLFFTLSLLVAGLAIGCYLAWKRIDLR